MKKIILTILFLSTSLIYQTSFAKEVIGNVYKGEFLFGSHCLECHSGNYNSSRNPFGNSFNNQLRQGPLLFGSNGMYVYNRLMQYKKGEPLDTTHYLATSNLTEQQIADIAAYISIR